jgi:toxin ParE1/3/4
MMRLRKAPIAEQDLFAIWDYIAQDSPTAADRFLLRLADRFQSLLQNPLIGESQNRFRDGLRSVVEGNYVIFYEPRPNEILIYRVLHGARNWEEMLSDPKP